MLQIKNLTVTLIKDNRTIIRNLSFVVNPGDKMVIIGEEGNGKSTLLKLIYDPELVEGYAEYTGELVKNKMTLGYLAQELSPEELTQTVSEYVENSHAQGSYSPKELNGVAAMLGLKLELFSSEQRVNTLSGGEKVKLQLARILLEQPDILLLDEPSNDIDIETLEWLEDFINTGNLPILFVSHDETLIENTANGILHFEQVMRKTTPRHTVARMPYRQYYEERLAGIAHQEQVARKERTEYQKQEERWQQIYERVKHEQATISRADPGGGRLLKKKMKAVKSQEKRFEREKEEMTPLPEGEDAIALKFDDGIAMPGGKVVLDLSLDRLAVGERVLSQNLRLYVKGAEHLCITGKNGAGKTTLLKIIAAELLSRSDIRAVYMPQNYEDMLDASQTPVTFLANSPHKDDITKARLFLGSMKYTAEEMNHSVGALSGGQKAKLFLIKMVLSGGNVLLLDEPTRNFSPLSNPVIRQVLRAYQGTIISVSHDRKFIDEVCDKVYRLTESGLERK